MPLWEPGAPKPPRGPETIEKELAVDELMKHLDSVQTLELLIEYVRSFGKVVPVDLGERMGKFGTNIQVAAARVVNKPDTFANRKTREPLINDMLMLGKNLELMRQNTKPDELELIESVLIMMLSNYNNREQ